MTRHISKTSSTNFDLQRARKDTPGCKNVVHFNNAGAALRPKPVIDALRKHEDLEDAIGGYEAARMPEQAQAAENFYHAAAKLLGCTPKEIAFVENATRAWDMAFYSIPFKTGDRILMAQAEYASNAIAFLQVCKRTGAKLEVIPSDGSGQLSIPALKNMMDDHVKLIAITHIPTNGGLVNPAAEVGKVARDAKVLYLLDACQSVGQMPVNVDEVGCDMLSVTGRKYLRGPRGTGFLYVRENLIEQLEPPFLDLHAATWVAKDRYEIRKDAKRFENWESNVAGKIALGVAIDYGMGWGLPQIWERIQDLAAQLRHKLNEIPGVKVQDIGAQKCGIVTFTVDEKEPQQIKEFLAFQKPRINVNVSAAASTRLDMEARGLTSVVRASVHYYNSEEEVERFCKVLTSMI